MKRPFITLVLFINIFSLYALGLDSNIVIVGNSGSSTIVQYTYNGKITNIVSEEFYRSAAFSQDGKYIMILCGSDVVGSISFYNSVDGSKIGTKYYTGKKPFWENNSVEYEEVNWLGVGFTIRQHQKFTGGKFITGKQFVGGYHGSDNPKTDPMCPSYKFASYSNIQVVLEDNRKFIEYWSKYYFVISRLKPFEFDNIEYITKVSLEQMFEIDQELINQFKVSFQTKFLCISIFNHAYILMEHAFYKKILTKEYFNIIIMKFLNSLSIDNNILPWLFKY